MSLQPSAIISNTGLYKKQAVKIFCMCVAGLAIVVLLLTPRNSNKPAGSLSSAKQSSSSGSTCTDVKKQGSSSSTFSLMPGRLNRFLQ